MAKNKYWQSLIWRLEIAHANFYYVMCVCTWFVKTEVEVMEEFQLESCVQGNHIYKTTWTPLLEEVLSAALWPRVQSFGVRVDNSHIIFLRSVGPAFS